MQNDQKFLKSIDLEEKMCYNMNDLSGRRINCMGQKLPIGVQGFVGLRSDGYLYVDKTEYINKLVQSGKQFFLSRPRRFGKSLLISTLKAYWEGKQELFKGLAISGLEADRENAWKEYPVFRFDFNGQNYRNENGLEDILDEQLRRWEKEYDVAAVGSLGERFRNLLITASQKKGLGCVVLVDEYDKPFLDVADDIGIQEHNKEVFRAFFSTLKSFDDYIRFVFITGVTKFHKVSIFSDLNQLNDISLNVDYSGICGITDEELRKHFSAEVKELAETQEMSETDCLVALKQQYDGYRFNPNGVSVYNPFSLLKAFFEKDFGAYWYETGTPAFLVKKLKHSSFDIRKLDNRSLYASESMLKDYSGDDLSLIPLLYQTGYLTIAGYDRKSREYTLAYPNMEVKYGFLESMMPEYVSDCGSGSGKDIFSLNRLAENGDLEGIHDYLVALFASIPYTKEDDPFEHYFQTVIYLVFTLLGHLAECEIHTFSGRIDCKVETTRYVYIFEFKRDASADEALKQIEDKSYSLPFTADSRKLFKIGAAFDSNKRMLTEWKVAEN